MLDNLKEFIDALGKFDAAAELRQIVDDNKEKINELQQQQLAGGIDITGEPRRDEYRPYTIEQKEKYGFGLGAETDRVTFYMSGELYSSLMPIVRGDEFVVESPLPTFDKMIERIGDEKYGLDEQSRGVFAEEITIPEFGKVLEEQTGLKL